MNAIDVVIIGGGQAGLAMSRCLSWRGLDHVVLERGTVGQRWKDRPWEALTLLTPNWMNGLPGHPYGGDEPDGYMSRDQFLASLTAYGAGAPVRERTTVLSVEQRCGFFLITTDRGPWRARAVVVATGECDIPVIPGLAQAIDPAIENVHAAAYRAPASLPDGGVLVVGASSSGVQIADELRRAGRDVTLAVGRHTRLPRMWRGEDVFRWLQRTGAMSRRTHTLPDIEAARRQPSLQLAGRRDRSNVDLATRQAIGVRLAGRVVAAEGGTVAFADDLAASVAAAETKQARLLGEFDAFAGIGADAPRPPIARIDLSRTAPRRLALGDAGIRTIVWATGYRRAFPWLRLAALTPAGDIAHRDGVTAFPGLYALGFRLLRKRDSNVIVEVGADADALCDHIAGYLGQRGHRAA